MPFCLLGSKLNIDGHQHTVSCVSQSKTVTANIKTKTAAITCCYFLKIHYKICYFDVLITVKYFSYVYHVVKILPVNCPLLEFKLPLKKKSSMFRKSFSIGTLLKR